MPGWGSIEVFETGMNAAVVKLAEAAAAKGQRGGGGREPLSVLGAHPTSGKELKVMEGKYGPYVSDGEIHATLPKSADPKTVTLEEGIALIDEKAAKGPGVKKKKAPTKKKAATKKVAVKKVAAKT